LIKLKGGEGLLDSAFTNYINSAKLDNVPYVRFDLHNEVGHTKYQNLSKLFNETDTILEEYNFFSMHINSSEHHVIHQTGTLRTNCKDNLDRTNLVQSRFAMKMAWKQLAAFISNIDSEISIGERDDIEKVLRVAWANNGDALSIQYAGTAAMRSDHTRTGKTTLRGMWNDALGAITRYYINNFEDGTNQDALDIVTGNRTVTLDYKIDTSNYRKLDPIRSLMGIIFSFFFKALKPSRNSLIGPPLCFIWMLCVFIVWKFLFLDPNRIVDLPRLKSQRDHSNPKLTQISIVPPDPLKKDL